MQSSSGLSQSNRYQSNPTFESATPVFRTRYNQTTISKGPSQLSVNSNPFDDEYETISEISAERTSIRHSARKKRRAPQPPISVSIGLNLPFITEFKEYLLNLNILLIRAFLNMDTNCE